MSPQSDHNGSIVSAHTLSVESMLRKISQNGKVYAGGRAKKFAAETAPIEVQKLGLRDVSVFNGFCQRHDAELFSCLDVDPYRFAPKQNFMLAYRAVARECYLKRKMCESIPTPEDYANIHGINEKLSLSEYALVFQAASLKGAEEIEALKASLDKHLLSQSWERLVTKAIIFPNLPSILATCCFQPFLDMSGVQLQDFENLEIDMSQMCMSLIPLESGGAAIFSWPDTSNNAPQKFYDSVINSDNLTASVIHAILDTTENFAFNPSWYESLSNENKKYIFSRVMIFGNTTDYEGNPRPDKTGPFLDDWGIPAFASF